MTLTPIRVRRKRKTPSTDTPLALRRGPQKAKKSLATVLASRSLMDRPSLESLPTEMLETILLYSSNLALPRSSHVIGSKLSNRTTQLRMFISAFQDTWDQWFGIPTNPSIFHGPLPARREARSCEGDYALQSEMLELSWVNIDFILQAQQTWANNHARDRWYQHSPPWEDEPDEIGHDHDGGFSHFDARECFEVDYQQALKWPGDSQSLEMWAGQDVHPRTRIPLRLITGPWDDEMQRRLFWLARGGFAISNELQRQPPWEIKIEFLRNAVLDVSEPNALVINCLHGKWAFTGLPEDVTRKEVANLEKRLKWGGDTPEGMHTVRQIRFSLSMSLFFR